MLDDGTHTYLYGNMRIAQQSTTSTEYFLTDALGSVRQLVDETGELTLAQVYQPYGETLSSVGSGATSYGFTGESRDATGLIFLRARYYAPGAGVFLSKDTWSGVYTSPLTLNKYTYGLSNPINYTDPSGNGPIEYCLGILLVLASADGPLLPVGDVAGLLACAAILGVSVGVILRVLSQTPDIVKETIDACTITWEYLLERVAPDPDENPRPRPQGTLIPIFPTPIFPTPSPTPQQKPIVLDLGPSLNIPGEIMPLLNHYRGWAKIVVIDESSPVVDTLKANPILAPDIPDNLDIIQGDYGNPDILSRHGYGCAIAAYNLWPNRIALPAVPSAIGNLVCEAGHVHIISENPDWYDIIYNGVENIIDVQFSGSATRNCIENPFICAVNYGGFSGGIGFTSSQANNVNYALIGTKR